MASNASGEGVISVSMPFMEHGSSLGQKDVVYLLGLLGGVNLACQVAVSCLIQAVDGGVCCRQGIGWTQGLLEGARRREFHWSTCHWSQRSKKNGRQGHLNACPPRKSGGHGGASFHVKPVEIRHGPDVNGKANDA